MSDVVKALIVLLTLLATIIIVGGCTTVGLYQMSDKWCDQHPDAHETRCWSHKA